jgi:UDP:flavonoid glycosyltransferase YjiC (YdhE family)
MSALPHCLAFFVTPHGFGHASRATAVAESLAQRVPQYEFQFFTTVPEQHIGASLATFRYHPFDCDVGLVQTDALHADLPGTIERLNTFLPFNTNDVQQLADFLQRHGCVAIISDIAPLGIEVARAAKLPSVLIENFTWDWIYRAYSLRHPDIGQYAEHLSSIFARADLHIQCRPQCYTSSGSILTSPVSRRFQKDRGFVRNQLGLSSEEKMVFISMGGTPHSPPDLKTLGARYRDIIFLVADPYSIPGPLSNVRHLPLDNPLFHPDLIRAADVVIGKAGYSTIAEVFHAGVPFGYFSRPGDPEMPSLLSFINETIKGVHFTDQEYESNAWFEQLSALLSMPRIDRSGEPNGADQCANEIIRLLQSQSA